LTFSQKLIPRDQGEIILRQVLCAFEQILEYPDALCMGWASSPRDILSIVPAKMDTIPTDIQYLHDFVTIQRLSNPNKIALEFASYIDEDKVEKQTWSYRELDEVGNRIANYLIDKGLKADDLVAVCFDKCPEASFAMLGILKAGCGFLALDHSAPKDRKIFIMNDSKTRLVLSMRQFKTSLIDDSGPEVIFMDENLSILKSYSSKSPIVQNSSPENTCYCLYTSGRFYLQTFRLF